MQKRKSKQIFEDMLRGNRLKQKQKFRKRFAINRKDTERKGKNFTIARDRDQMQYQN